MGMVALDNQPHGGDFGDQAVMADDTAQNSNGPVQKDGDEPPRRELNDAARRALAEAEARRRAKDAVPPGRPPEIGGRNGPDPVRYGDWEKDGIISDF